MMSQLLRSDIKLINNLVRFHHYQRRAANSNTSQVNAGEVVACPNCGRGGGGQGLFGPQRYRVSGKLKSINR